MNPHGIQAKMPLAFFKPILQLPSVAPQIANPIESEPSITAPSFPGVKYPTANPMMIPVIEDKQMTMN
jgi:hypothetical protein